MPELTACTAGDIRFPCPEPVESAHSGIRARPPANFPTATFPFFDYITIESLPDSGEWS